MSDLHRGVNDGTNNFDQSMSNYIAILNDYYTKGYALVLLGDIDNLGENPNRYSSIRKDPKQVIDLENRFYKKGRLYRVYGNHDSSLNDRAIVKETIDKDFTGITIHESFILKKNGVSFFMFHGHQGDFMSDRFSGVARFFVHYVWTPYQFVTRTLIRLSSTQNHQKNKYDYDMAIFGETMRCVTVCGHSHRSKQSPNYINTGYCNYASGAITYLVIDSDSVMLFNCGGNEQD
ncbi:metallophosphoesterase family protein [Candidatus Marinamargulisbacteria bacterium]|nr:metallophosphoesterase family protein [Candidatus Marinamargulisbacteria bacterium]